jgi:phospholipid/cholesterol/gamma-HCH transport system permease protein
MRTETPLDHIFGFSALAARTFAAVLRPPYRIRDIARQIDFVAIQSLWIIVLCVCAAAMVTIIEASFHMKLVIQNDSMVPGFAAMLILRELGAVVMALLVTSRAGAGMAAEIASMKVTEQIEALQMLGLDPIRFLVAPRFVACVISGAIMSLIANLVCLVAAMAVSILKLGYTAGLFVSMSRPFVSGQDLSFAVVKGAVFGAVIPLFASYCGLRCKPGAEGVGFATTNAVVSTSVAIIVLDFVLSYLFSQFY